MLYLVRVELDGVTVAQFNTQNIATVALFNTLDEATVNIRNTIVISNTIKHS